MGYKEAANSAEARQRANAAQSYRESYIHKPSGWEYGQKVKPTKLPKPEPKPKDQSGLTKRQRKRRAQLARRNAARKAETAALFNGIAALADHESAMREFAAESDSEASVLRQRRLRRESKRRNS